MTDAEVEAQVRAALSAAGIAAAGEIRRMGHGESGDLVCRIEAGQPLFAKLGDPRRRINCAELAHEVGVLRWLDGQAGAARLVWAGEAAGRPAMLTAAIEGIALHELPPDQAQAGAVAAIGALARLHALPPADCPFDERLAVKLAEARRRLSEGEIDLASLDPVFDGLSREDIWQALLARQPTSEDLVVTHGDASWPNFIFKPDGTVGLIDLGRAGVADRYQDLALFVRSAARNFPGLPIRALLAERYPAPALSEERLEFYRLLDEFY